jgi:prephenate dehydrogenase
VWPQGSETLFSGARCILTPTSKTDPEALQTVRVLWELAGSIVLDMDPFLHDKILGAVSHLPHVAAFALMTALADVRDHGLPELDLASHSGGGLRDTTRIAASSPEMWRDIFFVESGQCGGLDRDIRAASRRTQAVIAVGDAAGIEKQLDKAKHEREQLTPRAPGKS